MLSFQRCGSVGSLKDNVDKTFGAAPWPPV